MSVDLNQPAVAAAIVASLVALTVGVLTVLATWLVAERKLRADRALALSEKAWADYELRRDVYMDIARQISCLFADGDPGDKPELHQTFRKARLVGSDQVVQALNAFTGASRDRLPPNILEQRYRALFNAMRRDIRQLHASPPEGTDLGEDAFPIEA
jgi:hypothetical protein